MNDTRLRFQRKSKEVIERRIRREEQNFQQMLINVKAAKKEVDEIEQFLVIKDERDTNRKQNLWKAWEKNVFQPIQERIQSNLSKDQIQDTHEKRY